MVNKNPPIPNSKSSFIDTAATITKMSYKQSARHEISLDESSTSTVANSIRDKLSSNEEILKLFPDVELSIQILVASVLSPNDLLSNKLIYNMDDIDIPNDVNAQVLDVIRTHVNKNYKLEDKLTTILREAMFTKGAYIETLIPDTDILALSKQAGKLSTESYFNTVTADNILSTESSVELIVESVTNRGPKTQTLSLENDDLGIQFTENLDSLRIPDMLVSNLSTESSASFTTNKLSLRSLLRKTKKPTSSAYQVSSNNTDGSPLCMKLPVTSVLPIHMTSDPTKHISYFVLLDENGVPVAEKMTSVAESTNSDLIDKLSVKASIIKKTNDNLNGKLKDDPILANVNDIYVNALKASIAKRVNNGKIGSIGSIPEQSDFYQTVMSRATKGLKTRILYIPKENLTYFAFDYRDNGTGKSLLEKSMMLFSIRATNLFTRIMANVKNSVTTTKITAELDPTDPDPERTKEMIINQAKQSEQSKYPIGNMSIRDLVDWLHNVGYIFDVKHPMLPDISIDVSDENRNIATPDSDFDDMIQEHIIMSFGLNKEMVMAGYDPEFATTVVSNNVLFAKRVVAIQNTLAQLLSTYVKNILNNDGVLRDKVCDVLTSNLPRVKRILTKSLSAEEKEIYKEVLNDKEELVNYVYSEYCDTIFVTPPKVELSNQEGSKDSLDSYSDMLDTYLELIISSETLPVELVGDISDKMDDIKSAIKTIMIKNWIDEHNFMPELTKFLTLDNTGKPRTDLLEEYSIFTQTLAKAVLPHLKDLKKAAEKTNDKLTKIEDGVDDEPEEGSNDDTSVDTGEVSDSNEDEQEGSIEEGYSKTTIVDENI